MGGQWRRGLPHPAPTHLPDSGAPVPLPALFPLFLRSAAFHLLRSGSALTPHRAFFDGGGPPHPADDNLLREALKDECCALSEGSWRFRFFRIGGDDLR